MPLTVGHSRSTRATRGPHHLDCHLSGLWFQAVLPWNFSRLLGDSSRRFLKPDWRLNQRSFRLIGTWAGLRCASAGPEAQQVCTGLFKLDSGRGAFVAKKEKKANAVCAALSTGAGVDRRRAGPCRTDVTVGCPQCILHIRHFFSRPSAVLGVSGRWVTPKFVFFPTVLSEKASKSSSGAPPLDRGAHTVQSLSPG